MPSDCFLHQVIQSYLGFQVFEVDLSSSCHKCHFSAISLVSTKYIAWNVSSFAVHQTGYMQYSFFFIKVFKTFFFFIFTNFYWNPVKLYFQEIFYVNYYYHYCYCTFIHCWRKSVSPNLEKKLIKVSYVLQPMHNTVATLISQSQNYNVAPNAPKSWIASLTSTHNALWMLYW